MTSSLLVIGGGTEALLAALVLQARLPGTSVAWLRCQSTQSEYLSQAVPCRPLFRLLHLDANALWTDAKPTIALGTRFLWGGRGQFHFSYGMGPHQRLNPTWPKPIGYYCGADDVDLRDIQPALMAHDRLLASRDGMPVIHDAFVLQFTSVQLESALLRMARQRGVRIIEGRLEATRTSEGAVSSVVLADGQHLQAEVYVDASGPGALLLGEALHEPFLDTSASLPCDRCLEALVPRAAPLPPCTVSRPLDHGWTWETHHMDQVGFLHAYSSNDISDEAALAHFCTQQGPLPAAPIRRALRPGRRQRRWVGNVVGVGAAAAEVGPLHDTRLDQVLAQASALAETLAEAPQLSPTQRDAVNLQHERQFECLRGLMAVHHRLNDGPATPFWQACRDISDLGPAARLLEFYRENGPSGAWERLLTDPADRFSLSAYFSTFLGFNVPFHRGREISKPERDAWAAQCAANRAAAERGFTPGAALSAIHSGKWQLVGASRSGLPYPAPGST